METVVLKPIGRVKTGMPVDKQEEWSRWKNPSYVEIYEEYRAGLKGLDEYSHVFIIFYLHLERRAELLVRPRKRLDLPEVGVFASRGPTRPNPIGLAVCRLVEVHQEGLKVLGLDAYPDTPVLDIKPYDYYDVVEDPKVPAWFKLLWREKERG